MARTRSRGAALGPSPGSPDLLAGYDLATPLFAALEAVAGWPVRLVGPIAFGPVRIANVLGGR